MASKFIKTYTSFSGSDLVVSFGPCVIGELQQITWGVQREKAPVYTLGNPDPRSYSRGKRAIAGNCVFAVFDRDALIEEMTRDAHWKVISPKAMFTAKGNLITQNNENFEYALELMKWNKAASTVNKHMNGAFGTPATKTTYDKYGDPIVQAQGSRTFSDTNDPRGGMGTERGTGFGGGYTGESANWQVTPSQAAASDNSGDIINRPPGFGVINNTNIAYADILPPLDVTMTFANEYGQAAFQKIYDLEFLNDASGVSVDSIVMERQMTWVGRRVSSIIAGVYTRDTLGNVFGTPVYV